MLKFCCRLILVNPHSSPQVTNMSLSTVGWGSLVLMVGLTARVMGAFMAVSGGNNNVKEKLFISLAWLPKATVQAALGPVALGKAREVLDAHLAVQDTPTSCSDQNLGEGQENIFNNCKTKMFFSDISSLCSMISYGEQILTIAVMAILLTAPLGKLMILSSIFFLKYFYPRRCRDHDNRT